jgi:hypothetical protein
MQTLTIQGTHLMTFFKPNCCIADNLMLEVVSQVGELFRIAGESFSELGDLALHVHFLTEQLSSGRLVNVNLF